MTQGSLSEEERDSPKDCRGKPKSLPRFARRFAKGIRKLTGNMSGDYRKKTKGLAARISEAVGLARVRS
ncbi:hypothetical protein GW17_00057245 [Ensete ventricosum]|nr:hypothetical protein GW17_00057245 [Ensete ventricosum]